MNKTRRTSSFRKLARRRKKQQLLKQERIKKNGVIENKSFEKTMNGVTCYKKND